MARVAVRPDAYTLSGGAADERLDGGAGSDTLVGGQGADVFIFSGAFLADAIQDFEIGTDRINLLGLRSANGGAALTFDQLALASGAGYTRIQLDLDRNGVVDVLDLDGNGTTEVARIDLMGIAPGLLTAASFVL